jgi:hypothetical protein
VTVLKSDVGSIGSRSLDLLRFWLGIMVVTEITLVGGYLDAGERKSNLGYTLHSERSARVGIYLFTGS